MKKIILATFYFLFFSCNTTHKNSNLSIWTDEEKNDVFKTCMKYSMEIENLNVEKANEYCYCSLDVLVENFENRQIAQKQISLDNSLRDLWVHCK
tara:strand:+ start:128 stop:412 length:285 start_codon:yes stop_codon:yes gene_type:complete